MNKKIFSAVIALVMVAVLCCACNATAPAVKNSSVANDPGASSALSLSHSTLVLPSDEVLGKVFPYHTEDPLALEWHTQDSSVAEVSLGLITPVSPGTTEISCTDGVNTARCTVIVTADMDTEYTLRMSDNAPTVAAGDTGKVEYTYTGPGAVAVFSNNPQVVQVENGCYTAVSPGTAVITCTDGIYHTQCVVTVTESSPSA